MQVEQVNQAESLNPKAVFFLHYNQHSIDSHPSYVEWPISVWTDQSLGL